MAAFQCNRCGAWWGDRVEVGPALMTEVADLVRGDEPLKAMKRLCDQAGTSLAEAKVLVHHVTREPGHCHRCRTPLPRLEQTECGHCRASNLDW